MAHYKTPFTHIRGWIDHPDLLYIHTSILWNALCNRAAVNFSTSFKDWGRQICTKSSRRKSLTIVSSGSGIWRTICLSLYRFLWNKRANPCLFNQAFGPLHKVMEYDDRWCLWFSLVKLKSQRELSKNNNTAHKLINKEPQVSLAPSLPTTMSQSRARKMGSPPIDGEIAICHAYSFWPCGPWPHHPCHRHWNPLSPAIVGASLAILNRPVLEIFRSQNLQYVSLESLTSKDDKIL